MGITAEIKKYCPLGERCLSQNMVYQGKSLPPKLTTQKNFTLKLQKKLFKDRS